MKINPKNIEIKDQRNNNHGISPKVMYPMLSPTAASVSFSSSGGSLWLNNTCGAVWLARRPSLNSYKQITLNNNTGIIGEFKAGGGQEWNFVYVFNCLLTCMKTLPMMTSSSSLNTVLKTTVTLSFLASTYLTNQRDSSLIRMTTEASVRCWCAHSYTYMDSSSL